MRILLQPKLTSKNLKGHFQLMEIDARIVYVELTVAQSIMVRLAAFSTASVGKNALIGGKVPASRDQFRVTTWSTFRRKTQKTGIPAKSGKTATLNMTISVKLWTSTRTDACFSARRIAASSPW